MIGIHKLVVSSARPRRAATGEPLLVDSQGHQIVLIHVETHKPGAYQRQNLPR
jgi:hypothetical protein